MRKRMIVSNRAKSTIEGYLYGAMQLALYCNKPYEKIDYEDVLSYLVYLREERKLSRDTMRIYACGIKYIFKHIVKREHIIKEIPYPKREKYLPEILSGEELKSMFDKTLNLKHRAFLKLVYSAGLRREEACTILPTDINSKDMEVKVRQGKGKKARLTLLSEDCLHELRRYVKTYRPKTYLFEGKQRGTRLSGNSTRWIMNKAKERANITKKVSLHNLRHSFASHLLSIGTNLISIKELLGHEDIRTTMIYLHIQHLEQKPLTSPLDIIYPRKKKATQMTKGTNDKKS